MQILSSLEVSLFYLRTFLIKIVVQNNIVVTIFSSFFLLSAVPATCKHLNNLIMQLSDKHRYFLKHLLLYWNMICSRDGINCKDLPFVKKKTDCKSLGALLSFLVLYYDQIFQVRNRIIITYKNSCY